MRAAIERAAKPVAAVADRSDPTKTVCKKRIRPVSERFAAHVQRETRRLRVKIALVIYDFDTHKRVSGYGR